MYSFTFTFKSNQIKIKYTYFFLYIILILHKSKLHIINILTVKLMLHQTDSRKMYDATTTD